MHNTPCLRPIVGVLAVLLLSGTVGCKINESRRAAEKVAPLRSEDIKVTAEQVRLRMRSLVGPMCGNIEQAADAIIAGTSDPDVQLAALEWKMDAVPAMREALFRPDPYTAAFDAAALCVQMIDYFDHGPGKQALGPASAQAADACRRMADAYFKVIASATISRDVSGGRAFVERWAAEHPIRHSISDRESALTRVFEQQFSDSRAATYYVAAGVATADDMTRKMDVYSDQLFRQARWEVARLRLELVRDFRVDQVVPLAERAVKSAEQAVARMDHLTPELERGLTTAQDAPRVVAAERVAVIKALHDELTRTLQDVRDERVAALEQVTKERSIATKEIRDALAAQASQLTNDADRISVREIDRVMKTVLWLVGIAMAVAMIAGLLGLLFLRRLRGSARHTAN